MIAGFERRVLRLLRALDNAALAAEVTLRATLAGCGRTARRIGRRYALDHFTDAGYSFDLAASLGVQVARDYQRGHFLVRPNLPKR